MFPSTLRPLAGVLLLSAGAAAQAATLLVTVKTDSYDGVCNLHCSLRDAVQVANQTATPSTILLPSGTYVLSRANQLDAENDPIEEDSNLLGDLDITGKYLIKGVGAGKSIIQGRINDRLLEVRPGAHLTLDNLSLEDGNSYQRVSGGDGGALENHGYALLRRVRVKGNKTENFEEARGGAIANYGELLVLASHFEGNNADSTGYPLGGAIYSSGTLWIRDSSFINNVLAGWSLGGAGAAIYSSGGAIIERSSFSHNHSGDNTIGGAITNQGGSLTLSNSTLSGNVEGALSNGRYDPPGGPRSRALLTNVTIAGNTGYSGREAVRNWAELLIRNSIIAGNQGGFGDLANCSNFDNSFSYQAIGLLRNDEQSNCAADLFVPDEQTFTQVLAPDLASDGKTSFHALLPGSPAVDAAIGDCIAKDQRGVTRPQDGNGDGVAVCDLGAYELIP